MNKFNKIILIIFEWGFFICIALSLFLNYFIQAKLEKVVEERLSNYYNLDYNDIQTAFKFSSFDVTVSEPHLNSTDALVQSKEPLPLLSLNAKDFQIKGISTWDLLFSNEISLGTINLNKPKIYWNLRDSSARINETNSTQNAAAKIFKLDNIRVKEGTFKIFDQKNDSVHLFSSTHININIANFKLNNAQDELNRLIQFSNVEANLKSSNFIPNKSEFTWDIDSLNFNYKNEAISIFEVKRIAKTSIEKQATELEDRKMMASFELPEINLKGIDFDKLLSTEGIHLKLAEIENPVFNFFVSRKIRHDKSEYKKTLTELIQEINYPLYIDSVKLNNADFTFEVLHPETNRVGKVSFEKLDGVIAPFADKNSADSLIASFKGGFMKDGEIELNIEFALNNPKSEHVYYGAIRNMPFANWNGFLGKVLPVEFTDGEINQLYFKAKADAMITRGYINIDYDDLSFEIEKKNGKKAGFLNWASRLVIDSDIDMQEDDSNFSFTYTRPKYKHQIFMWMGGMVEGLKKAVLRGKLDKLIKKSILPSS